MFVRFWGTRGSIPTPSATTRKYGGNTSCVSIAHGDSLLICDGGTGLRELGESLMGGDSDLTAHMFFSHTHWDHIQGFPYFAPVYSPRNTINIWASPEQGGRIHKLLSGQMRSEYFPVAFRELKANIISKGLRVGGSEIDGVTVTTHPQYHPGGCIAFRFSSEKGSVVYATDHELDLSITNVEESEADPNVLRKLPKGFVDFCAGADLLIVDSQYTDEEYLSKRGWGHPRATTAVDLAVQAGAGNLALFHHDPMQSDKAVDDKVEVCAERARMHGSELVVFGAREGLELKI